MLFKKGDIVKINPDFITAFDNGEMPQFSLTNGWLPEFLKDYALFNIKILSISKYSSKISTFNLINIDDENGTNLCIDFDEDGKLFSALNGPPLIIKINKVKDLNFCSCNGETVYKQLFISTYPVCKTCGKEKKQ